MSVEGFTTLDYKMPTAVSHKHKWAVGHKEVMTDYCTMQPQKKKRDTPVDVTVYTTGKKKNVTKKPDFQVKNQLGFLNQISESGVKEALPHKTYVQGG